MASAPSTPVPIAGKLPREFFLREDTTEIARDLLGKTLVVPGGNGERVSGRIVETEAYLGIEDRAAHSYGGRRTARTEIAYGPGGYSYVFFVYGMYFQFNVVTGPVETPHVVLIRALEPVEGVEVMRRRRGRSKDTELTSGPGKLCIAFGIDKSFYGEDLTGTKIWLEDAQAAVPAEIGSGPRVGIDYAEEYADKPWRFWLKGNPFVSKVPKKASK